MKQCFLACLFFLVYLSFGEEVVSPIKSSPASIKILAYNVYNFRSSKNPKQYKSKASKQATISIIAEINADIVILTEMGFVDAIKELQESLKKRGCTYRFWTFAKGADYQRKIVILSKFKPSQIKHVTNAKYKIKNVEIFVRRGFAYCIFSWENGYKLHVIGAHLKSKMFNKLGQSDMRRYEARQLHYLTKNLIKEDPNANILVAGDMNDTYDSSAIKEIQYRRYKEKKRFYDLRPVDKQNASWTHYWNVNDTYSRIDYFFSSYGLLPEIKLNKTIVYHVPHWFISSDHRPIVTEIIPKDLNNPHILKKFDNATRKTNKPLYQSNDRIFGKRKPSK